MTDRPARKIPEGFLFGAATAAFQVEGASHEEGRRDSVWDAFCRVPGAVINGDDGSVACDQYHLYRDDVRLMKDLGLDTYRFSTSWSRVRPDGGAVNGAGLDYYKRLVDELLAAGILPWLTLYHWDLPQALQDRGGWTNRDIAELFAEYAGDVHDALGDRVGVWTTLNEPWCASFLSYTAGVHAPGHYSVAEGLLASHHLLLGHGLAARELRARNADLNLGITLNLTVAEPVDPTDAADLDAVRRVDGQFNRWFLDPLFRGSYPADIVEDVRAVDADAVTAFETAVRPGDLDIISSRIDTLGVNYYHGEFLSGRGPDGQVRAGEAPTDRPSNSPYPSHEGIYTHERGLPRTPMGWEVQPWGLTALLHRVHDDYTAAAGVSLVVTENGAAYDDEVTVENGETRVHDADRVDFLRAHVGAVLDAIDEGVPVGGYFYWSLLDNFEWAWGYEKRFGIVRVDYATQERILKDSAREYRAIIADRALAPTLQAR